ncbi:MAG TPA: hypothetical protein VFL51_05980 [Pseudolabrys sp.]|nr:hypothetical protein [Pseudolabrys sp.]
MRRTHLIAATLCLALAVPAFAAETHDDLGIRDIMVPEYPSKAKTRHKKIERRPSREIHQRAPETREKAEPKRKSAHVKRRARGSSSPVYPTPLPPPLHYNPQPAPSVVTNPAPVPPAIHVPQTGRTLPNLPTISGSGPNGRETYQDRATRCVHQAGVYGPAAGNRNAYIGACVTQ